MTVELHPSFKKAYQKRIVRNLKLAQKTKERITLFCENPRHPLLQDHALVGKKFSFRVWESLPLW